MKLRACLFAVSVLALSTAVVIGQEVVFHNDFNGYPLGSNGAIGAPWNEIIQSNNGNADLNVALDNGNASDGYSIPANSFGSGTANQLGHTVDKSASATRLGVNGLPAHTLVTLSFEYYEPSGTSGAAWNVILGNGTNDLASATTAFSVSFGDGTIAGRPNSYSLNAVHRIDIVANTSASSVTYEPGITVNSLKYDVWVDGSRIISGYSLVSGSSFSSGTPITALRFSTYSSAASQTCFYDNIYLLGEANVRMSIRQPETLALLCEQLHDLYTRTMPESGPLSYAINNIDAQGKYPSMDYDSYPAVGLPSYNHVRYLAMMATAYSIPGSAQYQQAAIRTKILNGLDYWYFKNPQTQHKWYLQIGVPVEIAKTLVLMRQYLTPSQLASGIAILKYAYRPSDGEYIFESSPATGQNRIWVARLQVEAGALNGEYDHSRLAMEAITQEIGIGTGEGIQRDQSFHQHGPLLYNSAYGQVFGVSTLEIARFTGGTPLALPRSRVDLVADYLLDGSQWMLRGRQYDFQVMARFLASPNAGLGDSLCGVLQMFPDLCPARAPEADAFDQRIQGSEPPSFGSPAGNRMFWRSDYMVHHRPGYMAASRGFSTRTRGNESGNGENLKGYYTSTGSMGLMKTGLEYVNIMPVWNWRMIPGITAAQSTAAYPTFGWGASATVGTTAFVGGVSDDEYGAATIHFNRDGINVRKSWFYFDDEIVCLGAGLTASGTGSNSIFTTIEQNWNSGSVSAKVGGNTTTITSGTALLGGASWVLHGATGYYFPSSQYVRVQVESRTGYWYDINTQRPPSETQSGTVFSTWLDHGALPTNAGYSYVVLPSATASTLNSYAPPQILTNTSARQEVWHPGLGILQAVFHQAGTATLPSGRTFSVDQPCLLQARLRNGQWEVSAAEPTQTLAQLTVTLGGISGSTGAATLTLPTGDEAGMSVTWLSGLGEPVLTEVIVDNASGSVTPTGTWTNSSSNAGYYGSNYAHDGNTAKGAKSFRFTPALTGNGYYTVYIRHTSDPNRANNVPVDIAASSATETVTVNQQINGGAWISLGTHHLTASNASVTIRTTGTNGYVIADAVRFTPIP